MNDDTTNLDQTNEEILSYTVSDEALETAAGTEWGRNVRDTSRRTGCYSWVPNICQ
jgi:hypothetical protein